MVALVAIVAEDTAEVFEVVAEMVAQVRAAVGLAVVAMVSA